MARIDALPIGRPSFLNAPRCPDLETLVADVAVVGIPYTTPHDLPSSRSACSPAPAALREQSLRYAELLGHHDFEFGGELFAGRQVAIADCGDVHQRPGAYDANSREASAVVAKILERGALPLVLGGDQAASIPALRAYAGFGPLCVIHLGAELDWRNQVNGEREARPSALRRAAELPWVLGMAQIGLRGAGSAEPTDVADALAFGSVLVRAEELHQRGVEEALRRLPAAPGYYVSLNLAALDPAIAPGVECPAFGGLTYYQATNLLKGIASRGRVVGVDLVGIAPERDLHGMTSLLGVRLALNLLGALAHAGRLGARTPVGEIDLGLEPAPQPALALVER